MLLRNNKKKQKREDRKLPTFGEPPRGSLLPFREPLGDALSLHQQVVPNNGSLNLNQYVDCGIDSALFLSHYFPLTCMLFSVLTHSYCMALYIACDDLDEINEIYCCKTAFQISIIFSLALLLLFSNSNSLDIVLNTNWYTTIWYQSQKLQGYSHQKQC